MPEAERKLAAILAADVVGYSRLMQEDDRATLEALTERRKIFSDAVATRGGRIVNAPGDSILAEFTSVVNAFEAAVAIQNTVGERNAPLPEARRMKFRMGVNVGDVLVDGEGAIYGDGVNVAARLESLALAGGVCLSKAAHDQVRGRLQLQFEDLGEKTLKNIGTAVHVFRVLGLGAAPSPALAASAPKNSIAVLAFDNMSGDPAQEHFCDGICEDIITDLARINGMVVMGRQSSFAYKGKSSDSRKIGSELGVQYVMEGSVRTVGNRIRVNAQLIEAETGTHVWAQRYDRTLDDVFLVGDEITEEIVTALDVKLAHGEQSRIWRKALRSPKARELFYRGMNLYYAGTPQDMSKSRELFLEVIEAEPGSPWGYAQTAVTHCLEVIHGWTRDPAASLQAAQLLGEKAVALDETVPSGHAALGVVALFARRHDEAIQRLQKAYELRPMCSGPRAILGYTQLYSGDWQGAVRNAEGAVELNPLFPVWYYYLMGAAQHFGEHHEESMPILQKVRAANPRLIPARLAMIAAQVALGRKDDAVAEAASVMKDRPEFSVGRFAMSQPFRDVARRDRYMDSLRAAGLPD